MFKEFFLGNFDVVFFVYGLFFVLMGFCVFIQNRGKSNFKLANIIWLLGIFGLTHGLNEWLDMFAIIRSDTTQLFDQIRFSMLLVSYIFLFEFGRRFVLISVDDIRWKKFLGNWLFVFLCLIVALGLLFSKAEQSIWPRYCFGFPGGMLSAYGFFLYYQKNKSVFKTLNLRKYFISAACALTFYALLGGIFTPGANFFPASVLNYDNFLNLMGIPVQVFRALCALVLAWAMWHILGIFNWEQKQSLINEIKRRKEIEKDLRLFRNLVEHSNDAFYIINPDNSAFHDCSSKACSGLGYSYEELCNMKVIDIEEIFSDVDHWKEHVRLVKEKGYLICEGVHKRKDGSKFPVEVSVKFISSKHGEYIIAVARDITERKQTEEKIKKQAEFTKTVIDSLKYPFYVINLDYSVVLANKAAKTVGVVENEHCFTHTHRLKEPCNNKHTCPLRTVIETRKFVVMEHVHYDGHGNERIVEVHGDPIFDENGKVVQMIEYDIDVTERNKAEQDLKNAYEKLRQTQEELIQSSKMVAMGQLAAGISHELNQPLTAIKVLTQSLLRSLAENDPKKDDLQDVIEQADRMDGIITNVRFFARKAKFKMQDLSINQPIEDALLLLETQLKVNNINLKKNLACDLPKIMGDRNQLQQVFINLITNAKDAITMRQSHNRLGELTIKTFLSEDKEKVIVLFQDNGCGIAKHELENIFNPFYTTKSPDRGMGLGLSIVYRIIVSHNGKIDVESNIDKGTKITIWLPVYIKDAGVYNI